MLKIKLNFRSDDHDPLNKDRFRLRKQITQTSLRPPSTKNVAPVTNAALSLAKKATADAIS